MMMMDPATIVEEKEQLQHLVAQLVDQGFSDLLEAMNDSRLFGGTGTFNLAAFARDRGISQHRARTLLRRLREAATHYQQNKTQHSSDSLKIRPQTEMRFAA